MTVMKEVSGGWQRSRGLPSWALVVGAGVPALVGLGAVTGTWLARNLVAVTVRGASMEPSYADGDRVLVRRAPALTIGRVVVVERPVPGVGWSHPPLSPAAGGAEVASREWLIKRIAAVPGDVVPRDRVPALADVPEDTVPGGRLVLLGDNQKVSFDSRRFGYFPVERVLGAVRFSLKR
ncbi:S26 family signal peptidase [Streptomyces sp. URMC 127]|uniref:S26 family signal peptidase n=1 Tax=Streptomyces sp. URMC 127 TaxID=3423402 RepID=UPI003F1C9F84